jgi:hypothetical protein
VNIRGFGGPLLWRLQLALKPTHHFIGFDRIGLVALKALEHARSLPVGRCRHQNQMCPALGASQSFRLTHDLILPPVRNVVHFKVGAFHRMNTLRISTENQKGPHSKIKGPPAVDFLSMFTFP